jgi:hypothetical protein
MGATPNFEASNFRLTDNLTAFARDVHLGGRPGSVS